MEPAVKEKIENYYSELPPTLKAAVTNLPLGALVYGIGRSNGLAIDKTGDLAREVFRFIGGASNADDLIGVLLALNGGDKKKTAAVARQLNSQIFLPIRDLLKKATTQPAPELSEIQPPKIETPPHPAAAARAAIPSPTIPPPAAQLPEKKINGMALLREAMRTPATSEISTTAAEKPAPVSGGRPLPAGAEKKTAESSIGKYALSPSLPAARTIYPIPPTKREEGPTMQEIKPAPPRVFTPPPPAEGEVRSPRFASEAGYGRPAEKLPAPTKPMPTVQSTPLAHPSPYAVTRDDLEKEIERIKKEGGPRAEHLKPAEVEPPKMAPSQPPAGPHAAQEQKPPPLKLPQQKIPKPAAPDKYEVDPYKELVE